MQFTPKSDSEIEAAEKERKERWVWPINQNYDFTILGAVEKTGDYGEYIDLEAKLYHPNGEWNQTLRDFVGSESPRLKTLCYAVGLGERYEAGEINAYDFNNKSGKCKLIVKRDKSGVYHDKNKISDYVRSNEQSAKSSGELLKSKPPIDDEIPF
jgi:hypothetical protein